MHGSHYRIHKLELQQPWDAVVICQLSTGSALEEAHTGQACMPTDRTCMQCFVLCTNVLLLLLLLPAAPCSGEQALEKDGRGQVSGCYKAGNI